MLVTLPRGGDATAAVFRSGGQAWLTDALGRGAASGLTGDNVTRMGIDDRTLVGGLMPAGAVAARVTDVAGERHDARAGGGAWIALLDDSPDGMLLPSVCFLDDAGGIVRPPRPAGRARSPVADADEPCPACDATGWEEIAATVHERAAVACATCGHAEAGGGWFAPRQPEGAREPTEAEQRRQREQLRRTQREVLRTVAFPLVAPEGFAVALGSYGGPGRCVPPQRATLVHDDPGSGLMVSVETDADARRAAVATDKPARALEWLMGEPLTGWPDRSDAGRTVWLRARSRAQARAVARAEQGRRPLRVDGVAHEFEVIHAGDRWAATGTVDGRVVTVAARGLAIESVCLRTLTDPRHADPGPEDDGLPAERFRPLR